MSQAMQTTFGKVAVLMGGTAAEREISLNSGAAVLAALQAQGVDAHRFDPAEDDLGALREFDRAFVVLHGRGGEDGAIQGLLEWYGLPYTGSGVAASAIAMDKLRTKQLWQAAGLPTPAFACPQDQSLLADLPDKLGLPLFVKPAHEGSSIGMARVDAAEQLQQAWQNAADLDALVLVEQCITGQEYTCAVLDGKALPLIRLQTPHEFYDFDAKYRANSTEYHCPCGAAPADEKRWQALCEQAAEVVGTRGWCRVDFMVSEQGQPYLLEVNTVPGMTDHSLVPMAAQAVGISFEQLVLKILAATVADAQRPAQRPTQEQNA